MIEVISIYLLHHQLFQYNPPFENGTTVEAIYPPTGRWHGAVIVSSMTGMLEFDFFSAYFTFNQASLDTNAGGGFKVILNGSHVK